MHSEILSNMTAGPASTKSSKSKKGKVKKIEGINIEFIKRHKKIDILKPDLEAIRKEPKKHAFAKTKRPELFPVKDEHKNPCSYLLSNFSRLNKRGAVESRVLRDW